MRQCIYETRVYPDGKIVTYLSKSDLVDGSPSIVSSQNDLSTNQSVSNPETVDNESIDGERNV